MKTKEKEISLVTFWQVLRRYFWWIIGALAVGVLAALLYSAYAVEPQYSSTAEFVVDSSTSSAQILGSTYQSGMEAKANNIMTIVTGNVFLQHVADTYNAEHGTSHTVGTLSRCVSATSVTGTAAFRIKVSAPSAEEAYDFLKIFEKMVPDYLKYVSPEKYDEYMTPNESGSVTGMPCYITLISAGNKPTSPESPSYVFNAILGGFGAMLLVYFIFFFIVLFDKTIYTANALKESFNIPVLGEIPEWRQSGKTAAEIRREKRAIRAELHGKKTVDSRSYENRLLTERTPFTVAEAFKTLRTNLVYSSGDEKTPVIGIFSAFSGAGKSLIAANCAIGFAQLGKRVLLIDGDMRCPSQSRIFGFAEDTNGLSEYLVGLMDDPWTLGVHPTAFEGLDLMTSGRIPPNPGELLSTERMEHLTDEAAEKYDYVIIDLPPVCETSDAGVISRCVTGYLMVVRYAYSNISAVSDSVEAIAAVNGRITGFVMNDMPGITGSYGSYSGKYGKYGRYQKGSRYTVADIDKG